MLTIYGESTRSGSTFCSAARARHSLLNRCMGYQAYVVDTRVKKKGSNSVSYVPMLCDFLDVFLEVLPGVPLKRKVEFQIDLIPGAAPIVKAPYRLTHPEMQELSSQL